MRGGVPFITMQQRQRYSGMTLPVLKNIPKLFKPSNKRKGFYQDIQYELSKVLQNGTLILMDDFNAGVGSDPLN